MPELLPVDQNGSLAATDAPLPPGSPLQPPAPARPPMGPPQDPLQAVLASMGVQPQAPALPTPTLGPQEPPALGTAPAEPGMPGVATQPGAGSDPLNVKRSEIKTQQAKLQEYLQGIGQQKQQVQQQISSLMNPDAITNQLPGGGKQKPSDFLRDAMYNFAQLNLRNPTYGVLKGQDYKPIQQQRYEQALSQHNSQLQNLMAQDKSLQEQQTSGQFMYNQARQEEKELNDVTQFNQNNQLKMQQMLEKSKMDEANLKLKQAMQNPNIDLKQSQTYKNNIMAEQIRVHGNDPKNAMQAYMRDVYDPVNDPKASQHAAEYQRSLSNTMAQNGIKLSPDAVDFWAQFAATTGQLPAMGMGAAGAEARGQILNRAPQLTNGDIAGNKATYHADTNSLGALQKQRDAVGAFENTASANLDNFLATTKGIVDSNSPWINAPMRLIDLKGLGSGDLAAYNAARRVAINEIAKVTNNPNLSGVLTESARKEVESLIPEDATLKQVYSVARVLKSDMANRKKYLDEAITEVRGRMSPQAKKSSIGPPPPAEDQYHVVNGKKLKVVKEEIVP